MADPNPYPGQDGPSGIVKKLTKNDSADLPDGPPRGGLCVGTAGTLNFVDLHGNTCTDYPAQAGYNPIRPMRLKIGGTADNIWGLY